MKTYSLRTVYSAKGLKFNAEVTLRGDDTRIQFVAERTLPYTTYETTDVLQEGQREVTIGTLNRKFTGTPLLLEIVASCSVGDDQTPLDVRPTLEAQTASALALATWAWPQVVGAKLGEGLFVQTPGDDTWSWFDAEPFCVGDCYESPQRLSAELSKMEALIDSLKAREKEAVLAALRWWRHAQEVEYSADRATAYWVILEVLAKTRFVDDSIHKRVTSLLGSVFPDLLAESDGKRVNALEKALSDARCRVVHGGKRDVAEANATVLVARDCARASILYVLSGAASSPPDDELLTRIGVGAT